MGGLEFGAEAVVFGFVEGEVGVLELGLFRTGEFAGDEVREVGKFEGFVERHEVGFDFAGAHEPDAGEEDAVKRAFHLEIISYRAWKAARAI